MFELIIVPGSPALLLADAAGARLLATARSAHPATGQIDIVGSRDPRWYTAHTGSLHAWGVRQSAPRLSGGNYLPELMARAIFPAVDVVDSRAHLEPLARTTIVVVDGPAGLTPRAPLGLVEEAAEVHQWCQDLLAGTAGPQVPDNLGRGGIVEPVLWTELAAVSGRVTQAELLDSDDTLGVGRYVARWSVAE